MGFAREGKASRAIRRLGRRALTLRLNSAFSRPDMMAVYFLAWLGRRVKDWVEPGRAGGVCTED
jgi:hypothetical protein